MSLDALRPDVFIDLVQTAALLTVMGALIYAVSLLHMKLAETVVTLSALFRSQREMEERIERLWKRIDDIEMRGGLRPDIDETVRIRRLLDALAAAAETKKL